MSANTRQAGDVTESEASLLTGLRAGDDAAFEGLVRLYGGRMLAVVRRFIGNESDARDALQDAFLQAFRAIGTFHGESRLGSWLHRIAVNAALMKLRSQRRRPEATSVQLDGLLPSYYDDGHRMNPRPAWQETTVQLLEREETRRIVRESVDLLPDDYRTIILLRDIEELDTKEVAGLLNVSESVVKTRLHRARQALRTLLECQFARDSAR